MGAGATGAACALMVAPHFRGCDGSAQGRREISDVKRLKASELLDNCIYWLCCSRSSTVAETDDERNNGSSQMTQTRRLVSDWVGTREFQSNITLSEGGSSRILSLMSLPIRKFLLHNS